ncbi:MAG: hypothetical protein J6Y31_01360 [Bacteroidales bacterium]|nr:hypothetical protein [Bacteroidales bacterium]
MKNRECRQYGIGLVPVLVNVWLVSCRSTEIQRVVKVLYNDVPGRQNSQGAVKICEQFPGWHGLSLYGSKRQDQCQKQVFEPSGHIAKTYTHKYMNNPE